jgi:hypothetical protein
LELRQLHNANVKLVSKFQTTMSQTRIVWNAITEKGVKTELLLRLSVTMKTKCPMPTTTSVSVRKDFLCQTLHVCHVLLALSKIFLATKHVRLVPLAHIQKTRQCVLLVLHSHRHHPDHLLVYAKPRTYGEKIIAIYVQAITFGTTMSVTRVPY